MTCREMIDFLMDYLDGSLPLGERAEFERHLGECPQCATYLRTYEQTVRAGRLCAGPERDDAPLPEDLVRAILAARRAQAGNDSTTG